MAVMTKPATAASPRRAGYRFTVYAPAVLWELASALRPGESPGQLFKGGLAAVVAGREQPAAERVPRVKRPGYRFTVYVAHQDWIEAKARQPAWNAGRFFQQALLDVIQTAPRKRVRAALDGIAREDAAQMGEALGVGEVA